MKSFYVFACLILISHALSANVLTWGEAVKTTQANSLELQSALQQYQSTIDQELGATGGFLPKLTGSISQTLSQASSTKSTSNSATLTLTQNIFSGFSDINNYYLKKNNSELAAVSLNSAKAQISQELRQAFAEAYYYQEYKKLSRDILRRRQENYNKVNLQYQVGRENKGSLILSEAYVQQSELDLLSVDRNVEIALGNLSRISGKELSADTIIEYLDADDAKRDLNKPDFNLIALNHIDVKTVLSKEKESSFNKEIARAEFMPSLDFSGSYGYSGTKFFPDQDKWSLGLTLTIPLFNGLKDYSSLRSASSKLEATKYSSRETILKTTSKVKTAYFDFIESLQKEKLDKKFNEAAILRAEIARNKYKIGFMSFDDWDAIETELIARQRAVLESEKTRVIKQSLWEQVQLIGVFE